MIKPHFGLLIPVNMKSFTCLRLICLLLILAPVYLSAQEDIELPKELKIKPKKDKNSKLNFMAGGSFGATFGSTTCIDISPHGAYYIIKDHLTIGLGLNYTFYRERYAL